MNAKAQQWAERLRQNFSGPMTEEEIKFLRDIQAMIEFSIRNGLSFAVVCSTLGHDVNEIGRDLFDFQKAKARGFRPKVSGSSELTSEAFGESPEEEADNP
ncbi:MAG: hypothetical protein EXS16_09565 [Gemmataceae bacterium]|nr:hypothetical protein [Gemmataceae bacterium]